MHDLRFLPYTHSLVKRRKDLSGHTTLFAESFGALADAEEIESLQKAMHQMADVEVKVARLHSKQENRDFYSLSEIAFDYLQMIQAVKVRRGMGLGGGVKQAARGCASKSNGSLHLPSTSPTQLHPLPRQTCFQQRMAAFRAWQNAESALVKKKEAEANYTAKNRVEKLDQAAREVAEAEEHVTQTHEAFDKLSARLKKELKRFEIVRVRWVGGGEGRGGERRSAAARGSLLPSPSSPVFRRRMTLHTPWSSMSSR